VNAYVVACPLTKEGFVIDPGGDDDRILSLIRAEGFKITHILNTHGHADHVLGNRILKESLGAFTCMHELDDDLYARSRAGIEASRQLGFDPPDPADIRIRDLDILTAGEISLQVIHTPGHTPGSVCFITDGHIFTGDTLFVGAVGRTDLTGGSFETLLDSLRLRIIPVPPETIVWPGHDYGETPTSTIAREIEENPYITDFILS
jgi:glyoxylase-like metal-dependent hydrolase (beta-lactamase superfamily II)